MLLTCLVSIVFEYAVVCLREAGVFEVSTEKKSKNPTA